MLWGALGVLVLLLVAVLVACPATPSGGAYVCANGTPAAGTANPAGQTRCASCNSGFNPVNGACLTNYLCANGTPVDETTDTAGQTRCVSCDHPLFFALMGTSGEIGTTCRTVTEVGGAARISMVSDFGVVEGFPTGLAAISNILYMVGSTNAVLYTLDPTTGRATQMGSVPSGFGVSDVSPGDLAAIDSTLYMVGQINDVLYTLNIDSDDTIADGSADQVGSQSAGFGVGETLPSGLAAIDSTLYMVGEANAVLYTVNIDTTDTVADGSADQVGNTAAGFGVGETRPTGLAAINNTLYMVGTDNDILYTLNTTTGGATRVGSVPSRFGVGERLPRGLAAINSTLYMVGSQNNALYALRYQ